MSEVEEIKSRLSVTELISEYVRLTKAGSNWKALCPFHNEKTPSFMVSEEHRSFHCFGCGKSGDIFTFVMEMEGIGFREALEQLAQKAGVELKKWEARGEKPETDKKKLYQILELATKWYEKNLWEACLPAGREKGNKRILDYLHERGFLDETIKKFRLGYAPDGWRNILEFLQKKDFEIADIAKTGLLVEREKDSDSKILNTKYEIRDTRHYDRFRDRIMFPVQDIMGRVIGFSARVAPGGDEKTAKYINTPQTTLYDKSRVLYGLHLAKTEIKKRDETILVEGNTDVIASHQAGFPNTVAVSGTALAPEQIKIVKRYTENLKMAFDMDSAGQEAAKRSARICLENDLNVKIVLLPKGKDAADVIREDKFSWEKAVSQARGVIEYFFEDSFSRHDSGSPTGKKKIARELLNIIKDVASPIEKAHWVKALAEKLGVKEETLLEVLQKAKSEPKMPADRKDKIPQSVEKEKAIERRIIGLLVVFPRETKKRRKSLNPADFAGEAERKIIEKIAREEQGLSPEKMKRLSFGYEAQKLIDEAVFEVEIEREEGRIPSPEEELIKIIKRHKERRLREKIVQITQDIKETERAGDKEATKAKLEEFQRLSAELGK